jgi:hypothetical protein
MSDSTNILRAFGMSGAQIMSDIQSLEKHFRIELTPKNENSARELEDYEQFEGDIRASASRMSEYYEIFYCLEVSIRRLVRSMMFDSEGVDWWESARVDAGFRTEVGHLQKKELESGVSPRSDNNLDYLTFGQLGQIITSNFDLFQTVLTSKGAVSRVMNQLNLLRNPIAHCCDLAPDEVDRLRLTVRDWFRLFM